MRQHLFQRRGSISDGAEVVGVVNPHHVAASAVKAHYVNNACVHVGMRGSTSNWSFGQHSYPRAQSDVAVPITCACTASSEAGPQSGS